MLSDDYEREQAELRATIEQLSKEIIEQENRAANIDKLIRLARKHLYLKKLTPTVLNNLMNAVYPHAPDKSSGRRGGGQGITISCI